MEKMLSQAEQTELQLQSENLQEPEGASLLVPAEKILADSASQEEAPTRLISSCCISTQFSDLPEICIAMMLACLSPIEVAKFACVSRSFYDASHSDLVWESFLAPPSYHKLLALQPNPPPQFASKKELFHHLCKPFVTSNRIQGYWLDRRTGGLSMSLAASALVIIWSENDRYWEWLEDRASMFPLVAELRNVCWFEGKAEIECSLPPGAYTLSWRILFLDTFVGWGGQPAHFKFSKNNGPDMEFKCYLQQQQQTPAGIMTTSSSSSSSSMSMPVVPRYDSLTIREVGDEWREFDAGEFVVESGEDMSLLKFCMLETTSGQWKRGLRLDGVLVRPSNSIPPSSPSPAAAQPTFLSRQPHNRTFPMDLGTFQLART